MRPRQVILRTTVILAALWAAVWGIRSYAISLSPTADQVARKIEQAGFADWSVRAPTAASAEEARRQADLRAIAEMIDRLDFRERQQHRSSTADEDLLRKLSRTERDLFVDLTIMPALNRFIDSMAALPAKQRKKFIEQGLGGVIESGGGSPGAAARVSALPLANATPAAMRAYLGLCSAETKLSLVPLAEAVNGTLQGLRGDEFNFRRHRQ